MAQRIKITGDKALQAKLSRLSDAVKGKAKERALVAGALIIQNAAKENAAVLSGNMRRSIHIGGHEDLSEGGNIVDRSGTRVPNPEVSEDTCAVYVGTDVDYAASVEFGTSRQAAQPFMRPAVDENKKAVAQEVKEAYRDLIQAAI